MEMLLSAAIYDFCCSKTLLPWTIFELGDDRICLHELYCHIASSRNVLQEDSSNHELKEARIGRTKDSLDPISDLGKRFYCIYLWGGGGVYALIQNVLLEVWGFVRVIAISV